MRMIGKAPLREGTLLHSPVPHFFAVFNLFGKEIEAQRTGRTINVDILAFKLIALHKQLAL